jgi:hypothetical protein
MEIIEQKNKTTKEKEKELVIARLNILFPEYHFTSGNGAKSFSRDEIINEIKKDSQVGKDFIKTDMVFLRALKDGSLLKRLNEVS